MNNRLLILIIALMMVFSFSAVADRGDSSGAVSDDASSGENLVSSGSGAVQGSDTDTASDGSGTTGTAHTNSSSGAIPETRAGEVGVDAPGNKFRSGTRVPVITNNQRINNEKIFTKLKEEQKVKIRDLSEENFEKLSKLSNSRVQELAQLVPEEIKARLKNVKIVEADETFKFRPLAPEQSQRSERAFEQLKENEEKLRERYEERLQKANETKERLKGCKETPDDEKCANVTETAIERSKAVALDAVERVKNHLEKVKERISGSQDIAEEYAAARITKIDALLAEMYGIKTEIEPATTKEELKTAIEKLKKIVKRIKKASEEQTHSIIVAQVTGTIHKMEVLEKKAECSLSSLEEQGTDTSAVDSKLEEYASFVANAREKISEAKEAFDPEDNEAVENARELAKEAIDIVKGANEKLDELRREIKALGGELCKEKQEIAIKDDGG